MNGYEKDKRWSDKFLPEIKSHIGRVLISESPMEEDMEHNTDLTVLTLKPYRIACRIRNYTYFDKKDYKNEFTIRSGRPSGVKTELTKIIEGWGDYLFYGFADQTETFLCQWFIGSLNVFRLWYNRQLYENKGRPPGEYHKNTDNSSDFYAYKVADIKAEGTRDKFAIASKRIIVPTNNRAA